MNSIFSRILIFSLLVVTISSCDKDANDIGANIIGDDHFGFSSYTDASIVAYNQATNEVQTDNLDVNQLGIYDNPVFGTTVASVGIELQMANPNPILSTTTGSLPVVTSVVLEVPYFSTIENSTAADVDKTYVLDSIIGTKTNKIKLSVYKSGFYIEPFNAVTSQNVRHFSDTDFDTSKIGSRLNDAINTDQNDEFVFSNQKNTITTTTNVSSSTASSPLAEKITTTTTYTAPSLKINLNNSFGTNILANAAALKDNTAFVNFLKGLYIKVEKSGANAGCLSMMNFSKGKVTINYYEGLHANGLPNDNKTIVLNIAKTVNILQHTNSPAYTTAISSPNKTSGDKKLYLKGGNGSVAYIDLFDGATDNVKFDRTSGLITNGSNFVPDELDYLKAKGWLINEANLVFNIDKTTMGIAPDPNRILVYNANNKIPVTDYYYDNTASTKPNLGKVVHSGLINGNQYKIRITNYIRNLVNKDSTNVRLGVCVNQNINNINYGAKKGTTFLTQQDWAGYGDSQSGKILKNAYTSNFFPTTSIMNPLGTVLYGNNIAPTDADYAKRLKLEIWYTKP